MSIVTDFKSINTIINRNVQKAELEAKTPQPYDIGWPYGMCTSGAVPLVDMTDEFWAGKYGAAHDGWPNGLASPIVAVTLNEGGQWLRPEDAPEGSRAHSVKFADGSRWDEINGWQPNKI